MLAIIALINPFFACPSLANEDLFVMDDGIFLTNWASQFFVGSKTDNFRASSNKRQQCRRDPDYNSNTGKFHCPKCNNGYSRRDTMLGHYRHECGMAPRFKCPYCPLCSKKTSNIYQHIRCVHQDQQVSVVRLY